MAEAFFKVLIEKLTSLIQKEMGLIMGVDKELKKLQSTLSTIQSVLQDAEAKQFLCKPIHNWLCKLNDAAFDIDDILDDFSELERRGTRFSLKKIQFSRKIGRRMKGMAERLDDLSAERRNFHLHKIVVPSSREVQQCRETGSTLIEPNHVYGRDGDKEKIVDLLLNRVSDCEHISVLPIIGVGGLGKTTLAQLVFNDDRVSHHFEAKLWVCVSDNFDLKIMLEAMIVSATENVSNLSQLDALQRRIRQILDKKRYLLILDDVWNENVEDWVRLRSILACGSSGASIIVTTRLRKVADIMGTVSAHSLKGLLEEDLWLLFKLRAFGRECEEQPNLETIGRQIVKKCGGVPLAAKALGGLLLFKREEKEWIRIRESEIWNVPDEENTILPALRLSYYHLPLELKSCFAYCTVFPKDSEMKKQDLIFHWMAHGCIQSNGIQEIEDVGDRIWNELVLRSFIHEVCIEGTRTTFKMHDLVHDLAQSIMESKFSGAHNKSRCIRRVYVDEYSTDSSSSFMHKVTTLTTLKNYARLRTLKSRSMSDKELSSAICKLKYLRLLDLTGSSIHSLPPSFGSLWSLQILILIRCFYLENLPKNIKYMTNLRHIFLDGCPKLSDMPSRIGNLTNLKTLSLFIVGHKVGNQLDQLQLLNLGGRLEIRHLERTKDYTSAKKANLAEKPNLRHLVLSWEGDDEESVRTMDEKVLEALEPNPNLEALEISWFRGSYFPLWISKMRNLTLVTIRRCPSLSRLPVSDLPKLKSLNLWRVDALEYIVDQNSVGGEIFPSLEKLRLVYLPNVKGLVKEVMQGEIMFKNLQELVIKECNNQIASSFPRANLGNLTHLYLEFSQNKSMVRISEDAWEGLCSLKELRIWNAREEHLPEKWFQGLKSLKKLELKDCKIRRNVVEMWLGHLTGLEELDVDECPMLEEIKNTFV